MRTPAGVLCAVQYRCECWSVVEFPTSQIGKGKAVETGKPKPKQLERDPQVSQGVGSAGTWCHPKQMVNVGHMSKLGTVSKEPVGRVTVQVELKC